jgi:hypothetical protein
MSAVWDGSAEHVFVLGTDGNIWDINFNGSWHSTKVTGPNGTIANFNRTYTPEGYVTATMFDGAPMLWGGASQQIALVGLLEPFTAFTLAVPQVSSISTTAALGDGTPFYIDTARFLRDQNGNSMAALYGGPWSELTGGQIGPLTAGTDAWGTGHVFWIGNDGHIHEYYQGCNGFCLNLIDSVDLYL